MIHKRIVLANLAIFLLFISSGVFAQTPKAAPGKLFFEKVYLHTDRDYYSTGEDIWFKAYVVDAQTNMPIGNTNNLHVDLISPDAKIMATETVFLNGGLGKGDFTLAD